MHILYARSDLVLVLYHHYRNSRPDKEVLLIFQRLLLWSLKDRHNKF